MRPLLRTLLVVTACALAPACRNESVVDPANRAPNGGARTVEATELLPYIERYTGGARPGETLPMLVAIHGMGDTPERCFDSMYARLPLRARVILPRAPTRHGDGWSWFPFEAGVRRDVQLANDLAGPADRIDTLVTSLLRQRPTAGRPLVAGFSQGGMLAYTISLRHGRHYAGVVPMAGYAPRPLLSRSACAQAAPMRALHGSADTVVPFAWDEDTMSQMNGNDCPVMLSRIPDLAHTSSPELENQLTLALRATWPSP